MATAVYLTEEGRLAAWFKNEGDEVQRGQTLGELEIDPMTSVDVDAPDSGVLRKRLVAAGERYAVGTMIAIIAAPGEDISSLEGNGGAASAPAPAAVQALPPAQAPRASEPAGGGDAEPSADAGTAGAVAEEAPVERGSTAPPADEASAPAPAQPAAPRGAGQDDVRPQVAPPARQAAQQAPMQPVAARGTLDDFLAARQAGGERTELVEGRVVPLGAASFAHNRIQGNLFGGLFQALRRSDCQVVQGMLVTSGRGQDALLPDVAVFCGDAQFESRETELLLNPVVLVEVLSPATSDYDHGQKWKSYRGIASLQEYLLVAQHEPRVEQYTRQGERSWNYTETVGLGGEVRLPSLQVSLTVAEIYERVFTADQPSA